MGPHVGQKDAEKHSRQHHADQSGFAEKCGPGVEQAQKYRDCQRQILVAEGVCCFFQVGATNVRERNQKRGQRRPDDERAGSVCPVNCHGVLDGCERCFLFKGQYFFGHTPARENKMLTTE